MVINRKLTVGYFSSTVRDKFSQLHSKHPPGFGISRRRDWTRYRKLLPTNFGSYSNSTGSTILLPLVCLHACVDPCLCVDISSTWNKKTEAQCIFYDKTIMKQLLFCCKSKKMSPLVCICFFWVSVFALFVFADVTYSDDSTHINAGWLTHLLSA